MKLFLPSLLLITVIANINASEEPSSELKEPESAIVKVVTPEPERFSRGTPYKKATEIFEIMKRKGVATQEEPENWFNWDYEQVKAHIRVTNPLPTIIMDRFIEKHILTILRKKESGKDIIAEINILLFDHVSV